MGRKSCTGKQKYPTYEYVAASGGKKGDQETKTQEKNVEVDRVGFAFRFNKKNCSPHFFGIFFPHN